MKWLASLIVLFNDIRTHSKFKNSGLTFLMSKKISPPLIKDVDYIVYETPDEEGNIVECLHCHNKMKNVEYTKYQHRDHCKGIKKPGNDIRMYIPGSEYYNSNVTKLRDVVRCVCQNCMSINSTQTMTFKRLSQSSFSYETVRSAIIDYTEDLKECARSMIKNKYISIVIDGATITTSGWYCVGLSTNSAVYYYDCYHLANGTTRCITEQLNLKK